MGCRFLGPRGDRDHRVALVGHSREASPPGPTRCPSVTTVSRSRCWLAPRTECVTRARRRTRDEGAFDTLLVPAGPSDGGVTEQPGAKKSEPPVPIASLLTISSTFDSLFKVLFTFPSRYLFAIGLSPVFSLGRSLPPDWGCIPKQPDSPTAPRDAAGSGPDGALTLPGAPFQGTWARSVAEVASPDYNSCGRPARFQGWAVPISLAVTRGILVSFFSSA